MVWLSTGPTFGSPWTRDWWNFVMPTVGLWEVLVAADRRVWLLTERTFGWLLALGIASSSFKQRAGRRGEPSQGEENLARSCEFCRYVDPLRSLLGCPDGGVRAT